MKSGPIKQGTQNSYVGRKKSANAEAAKGTEKQGEAQEPLLLTPEQRVDQPKAADPKAQSEVGEEHADPVDTPPGKSDEADTMPLGVKFDVTAGVIDKAFKQELVMGLVPASEKEALKAKGAYFPENPDAVLGDGVGPEGEISINAIYDTNNPETKGHIVTHEVDKNLLETNPETGKEELKSGLTPTILLQGQGVLPKDSKAVNIDSVVIPEGYVGTLGMSKDAQKVEGHRSLANNLAKTVGSFSGSSIAGIMNLPVVTSLAPLLAVGTAGFVANKSLEAKRDAVKQLGYLEQQEKKSTNDLVEMQDVSGEKYLRSAKNERIRLETAVRQANFELGSTALLAGAGGASFVGAMGQAGVAGFTSMAGAAAAAPYLAGGAMILGSGTMVFNSLAQLKELAKEKAELEAAQADGKTHVEMAVEVPRQVGVNAKTGKPIARLEALDEMVEVPIEDRLKQVEKEQRKNRLLATALSGGMLSIGNMVTGVGAAVGLGTFAAGMVAMAPAGLLLSAQSLGQLKELGAEKKELLAAKERGETMVEREVQQGDYNFQKERIPISTLLAENKKARNKHKLILTSVGTAGAALGVGLGISGLAAAPLALVPIAVGAMLFPDKVKVFADKVKGLVSGLVGESGSTKRAARAANEELVENFGARMDERLAGLKEQSPGLFTERASRTSRLFPNPLNALRKEYGGFYHEMNRLVKDYADSANPTERQEYLMHIGNAIRNAPEEAKPGMKVFQEELLDLSLDVEAQWTARDIALQMKDSVGQKVLKDQRAAARIEELGYKKEDIPEMYRETLQIMDFERQIAQVGQRAEVERQQGQELNPMLEPMAQTLQGAVGEYIDSVNGDSKYDNDRWAYRTEVLKASHHLASTERDLGVKLTTRFLDAAQQPENQDNFELLLKEVGYARQTPVTEQDVTMAANATRILETPISLAPESPDEHVAKLRAAIGEMKNANPELADKMLQADAKISNPEHFKGMTAQEALAERTKLNAVFHAAKRGLKSSAPEALETWQNAGTKIRELASQEPSQRPAPVTLSGPETRMANAYLGIVKSEPKLGKELGDAFAALISPESYAGMDASQVAQAKVGHNLRLQKARRKLEEKQPELLALWDGARTEVDNAYFDREMDQDFKQTVLNRPEVNQAAERLGIERDEVDGIYVGLMKSQLLHDPRDLNARLVDETGKQADPSKLEMLSIIDKAMLKTASEATNGGAETEEIPTAPVDPRKDPNVLAALEQRPDIQAALQSDGMNQLAENMQVPLPQVLDAYLTKMQAHLNPVIGADFFGRVEGGDINAVRTFQIGQAVEAFVAQAIRPNPEQLPAMIEAGMQGAIVQSVLADESVQQQAEAAQVDAEQVMRLYVEVEVGKDQTPILQLKQRADKGDASAQAQLNFLFGALDPAIQAAAKQLQAGTLVVPDSEPPAAA